MTTKTTTRLRLPATVRLPAPDSYRDAASAVVLAIGALALVLTLAWREAPPLQEAQPLVARPQVVFIVATPTLPPPAPTVAPVLVAAPPTAQPEVVYATVIVEQPIYVNSAPVVEPAAKWHPPLIAQNACSAWHPPLILPEEC